ncbi:hypothetical protein BB934_26265 [Microvirga ossetica]|uniref:Uncharacterized protein n=1 Tax=Microvirga ossetica TaxID=1882682 RepID=A0A1B2EMW4_9HYPH|nr:hypothetical protein [Microvirga ossetica]ANY81289.1 hypothetical protein BB934_26265 [Microvirga ossetica]
MTIIEAEPIACTLTPGEYKGRVDWIEALARQSLRSARREGLSLHLTYGPEAADAVRELVRKEQTCCAFLRFEMREDATGVHLSVTAPERAREAADLLFAHFVPELATPSTSSPSL